MITNHKLVIHGYADDHNGYGIVPEPLVHILYTEGAGDLQSISFAPSKANQICKAILRAAERAQDDKDTQTTFKWTTETEDGS